MNSTKFLAAAIIVLAFSSTCMMRVSGSSTISQSYEHTVYMSASQGTLALFTYRVGVSIQTEPDGAWKENSCYEGIFSVQLEWYDSKLFPYGISLVFPNQSLSMSGHAYASNYLNETVFWEGWSNPINLTVNSMTNYDWYVTRFDVGKSRDFQGLEVTAVRLHPTAGYYVFNSTLQEGQLGYQQWFQAQNTIYITVEPEQSKPLSETTFQDFSESTQKSLNSLQGQVIVLEIAVFVLVVLLPVSVWFARRRQPSHAV